MCGRYTLSKREHILKRHNIVLLEDHEDFKPRYNLAPTQTIPVILSGENKKEWVQMRWGLIPSWVKDLHTHRLMINARAETLRTKPSFKSALTKRRCLIPADGFYEWQKLAGVKIPIHIYLKDREVFSFAGLWDRWTSADGEVIRSAVIITVPANEKMQPIHDRMPAILNQESENQWLESGNTNTENLLQLLRPYPDELMEFSPVGTLVNKSSYDGPECILPLS